MRAAQWNQACKMYQKSIVLKISNTIVTLICVNGDVTQNMGILSYYQKIDSSYVRFERHNSIYERKL